MPNSCRLDGARVCDAIRGWCKSSEQPGHRQRRGPGWKLSDGEPPCSRIHRYAAPRSSRGFEYHPNRAHCSGNDVAQRLIWLLPHDTQARGLGTWGRCRLTRRRVGTGRAWCAYAGRAGRWDRLASWPSISSLTSHNRKQRYRWGAPDDRLGRCRASRPNSPPPDPPLPASRI